MDVAHEALATAGPWLALFATLLAAWANVRLVWVERRRDRASAEQEHRTQASAVSVWMTRSHEDVLTSLAEDEFRPSIAWRNASSLPIYNVEVYLWVGRDPVVPFIWQRVSVLPPTTETTLLSAYDRATEGQRELLASNDGVSIVFTDAAGSRWYRARRGMLHHLTSRVTWQAVEGLPPAWEPQAPPDWMRGKRRELRGPSETVLPQLVQPEAPDDHGLRRAHQE